MGEDNFGDLDALLWDDPAEDERRAERDSRHGVKRLREMAERGRRLRAGRAKGILRAAATRGRGCRVDLCLPARSFQGRVTWVLGWTVVPRSLFRVVLPWFLGVER